MSVALLMLLSCSENKVVPCSGELEIEFYRQLMAPPIHKAKIFN